MTASVAGSQRGVGAVVRKGRSIEGGRERKGRPALRRRDELDPTELYSAAEVNDEMLDSYAAEDQ
jgi:hypothetical protein